MGRVGLAGFGGTNGVERSGLEASRRTVPLLVSSSGLPTRTIAVRALPEEHQGPADEALDQGRNTLKMKLDQIHENADGDRDTDGCEDVHD